MLKSEFIKNLIHLSTCSCFKHISYFYKYKTLSIKTNKTFYLSQFSLIIVIRRNFDVQHLLREDLKVIEKYPHQY